MMGVGKLAQEFKHHGRAGQAGEIALIKGRRDFHYVGTNQIQSSKLTNAALSLQRGHPANFRRSGTGRIVRQPFSGGPHAIGASLGDSSR